MSARIEITPRDALIDVARTIRLSGFAPGSLLELTATQRQGDGSLWRSVNRFRVDALGRVDLDRDTPLEGDCAGEDVPRLGIVWSMRCVQPGDGSEPVSAVEVHLLASDETGRRADAVFVQRYLAEGVRRQPVEGEPWAGTLFLPAGDGPHPAVIVLNGSGGGCNERRAALWAAHGVAALALGYFKVPGRPAYISRTPLEYFPPAWEWLRRTIRPRGDFVALAGQSRGAELALLLAASYPQSVSAVVAYVPSSVVHGTLRAGAPGEPPDASAWTLAGKALPNVWQDNAHADWGAFDQRPSDGAAVRQPPAFVSAQADAAAVARSRIAVERIAGPILLVSGTDDGFWPSSAYAEAIRTRCASEAGRTPVTHLQYEGAGHAILFPHVPTTCTARAHPVAGVLLDAGGTPAANAYANADSWPRVLTFVHAVSGSV